MTYKRLLDWMIEYIEPFTIHPVCNYNYTYLENAVPDLHTSQFTVAHTLGFPVFTSRILATDS
jgi:hypothetical protein